MRQFTAIPSFTLIEILIVIGIVTLIFGISFAGFSGLFTTQRINPVAEDIVSHIREAREKTISSIDGLAYGIRVENSSLIIFEAPTYNPSNPSNVVYSIPSDFLISNINFENPTPEIIFEKITGVANNYGSITLQHQNSSNVAKVILIYEAGFIEIE